MSRKNDDPTQAMRARATEYSEVDEGTACTQSSFKTGKKSFFFIGMQGGRFKAMFKLKDSMPEAATLAEQYPDDYQTPKGASGWVTARFSAEKPMPKRRWQKWLDESYALSRAKAPVKKKAKASKKKTAKKRSSKKKAAKRSSAKGPRKS